MVVIIKLYGPRDFTLILPRTRRPVSSETTDTPGLVNSGADAEGAVQGVKLPPSQKIKKEKRFCLLIVKKDLKL